MFNLCTGHYMNYYNENGNDLFIIINEGNEPVGVRKLHRAEEICNRCIDKYGISEDVRKELEEQLEEVFEYGVQILIK